MRRLHLIILLTGLWAALYAASILVAWHTAPAGDGFTRGLNRVMLFFQYQIGAAAVALVVWWLGRALGQRWQRWLSRMPLILALALFLLAVGVIVVTNVQRPDPTEYVSDPDRPVTAPAAPVAPAGND